MFLLLLFLLLLLLNIFTPKPKYLHIIILLYKNNYFFKLNNALNGRGLLSSGGLVIWGGKAFGYL